jgi:hypothetical protein
MKGMAGRALDDHNVQELLILMQDFAPVGRLHAAMAQGAAHTVVSVLMHCHSHETPVRHSATVILLFPATGPLLHLPLLIADFGHHRYSYPDAPHEVETISTGPEPEQTIISDSCNKPQGFSRGCSPAHLALAIFDHKDTLIP